MKNRTFSVSYCLSQIKENEKRIKYGFERESRYSCCLIRFVHKKILFVLKKPTFPSLCEKYYDSEKAAGVAWSMNGTTIQTAKGLLY